MTKLLIVGEVMSHKDHEAGHPFSDGNGRFLKAMLNKAGINPRECKFTNVFMRTAPRGRATSFFGPKDKGVPNLRYLSKGKYLDASRAGDLKHLWKRINSLQPNLILALGDVSLWATTSARGIEASRGYITEANAALPDRKVLPTFSPQQINQSRANMPYWVADLAKAAREQEFPEIRYPVHRILIEPTLEDLESFYHKRLKKCTRMSVDIENKPGMITCIGFAPDGDDALVVPFYDSRQEDGNYWRTHREEVCAWKFVRRMLRLGKQVYGHNYIYDMQLLWKLNAIPNPDAAHDTMLLHHSLQPEMRKGLGILASIYTDEVSWKGMRTDTIKKED